MGESKARTRTGENAEEASASRPATFPNGSGGRAVQEQPSREDGGSKADIFPVPASLPAREAFQEGIMDD